MQELKKGNLCFYSRHPVLDQVAKDMASGISDPETLNLPVNIYVGTQKFRRSHLRRKGFHLGVQTEHFFDANGAPMWRRQKWFRTLRNALMYDRILDLSIHSRPTYNWLPKRLLSKIDFGPHIFPKQDLSVTPSNSDKALFFGFINERRKNILRRLPGDLVQNVPLDTYGAELEAFIASHRAVLNIHFTDGIYTEYPRLLSAYLNGKAVVSEKLDSSLIAGKHYLLLDDLGNTEDLNLVFENFHADFAQKHTLDDYLQRHFSS